MGSVQRVSVHGGHSGEFCCHAMDSLEEIVTAYIERGFDWVGITEHIPPVDDRFRYPEEIKAGLNARLITWNRATISDIQASASPGAPRSKLGSVASWV